MVKGLIEAFEFLKANFNEAIEISNLRDIEQNGLYLYFDGTSGASSATDKASFVIVVAGNSLIGNANSALNSVAAIRKRVFDIGIKDGKNYFKGIKAAQFEGSTLFLYAVLLEIEINIK